MLQKHKEPEVMVERVIVKSALTPEGKSQYGEFKSFNALQHEDFDKKPGDLNEPRYLLMARLVTKIKEVMEEGLKSSNHQAGRYDPENAEYKNYLNHVTIVATTEFFFYTRTPLQLREYEFVMQSAMNFAKKYPPNVIFILSSFAVLTPDNNFVMNVAPHFQCGAKPTYHPYVKNFPSNIDPRYFNLMGKLGIDLVAQPLNLVMKGFNYVAKHSIMLDGVQHQFTYDSMVACKTPGNVDFYSGYEICLDHKFAVLKGNLYRLYAELPPEEKGKPHKFLCTHVVTSNTLTNLQATNCISPTVVFCDPINAPKGVSSKTKDKSDFGTAYEVRGLGILPAHQFTPANEPNFNESFIPVLVLHILNHYNTDALLTQYRNLVDVNYRVNRVSPLYCAFNKGNLFIAKRLVDEFKADCGFAYQEFVRYHADISMTDDFLETALQVPKFCEQIDVLSIAKQRETRLLCMVLAAGFEYKATETSLTSIPAEFAQLLKEFSDMKSAAKTIVFAANMDLHQQMKTFLMSKAGSIGLFGLGLNSKEKSFLEEIKKNPEKTTQIVYKYIRDELIMRMGYDKDDAFLQDLLSIQKSLTAGLKLTVDVQQEIKLPQPPSGSPSGS